MRRIPHSLRFLGTVGALVLIFGGLGAIFIGALDRSQTNQTGNLLDPGTLFGHVGHFFQVAIGVFTTSTDHVGKPYHEYLLAGAALTIGFCFIAMPLALVLGLILALMSRSQRRILRVPARAYVEFFRNTPLLVQLLAIYWGLFFLPNWLNQPFTAGLATLVLNYAAYECENLRAGIAALDRGQGEAAEALGLSAWQSLRLIIIPQMIPIILPPVLNDLIYMFKDSSILSLLAGLAELTSQATDLSRRTPDKAWQIYLAVGSIYLLLSLPLARLARVVEVRLRSVSFAPKRDVTVTAAQVLVASVVVGILATILIDGLTLDSARTHLGQVVAGLSLTVGIMLSTLVLMSVIVYLPVAFVSFLRSGRGRAGAPAAMMAAK
jgi:His/Glu/Gln/Arg/opine family amino acid ABC transporter permease subunit